MSAKGKEKCGDFMSNDADNFLIHGKVFSIPLTPKGLPVLRILIKAGERD